MTDHRTDAPSGDDVSLPDAQAQDAPLKVHGDALLQGKSPSQSGSEKTDDAQRDEGF